MAPLATGDPHIEIQAPGARFDLHNAGCILHVGVDLQARRVDVVWSVENLLRDRRTGPYRTATVTLRISGVSGVAGTVGWNGEDDAAPDEEVGLDFIEYVPGPEASGVMRIALIPTGEIAVTGTECALVYTVVDEP